jgi:hypothetical protein
VSYVKTRTRHRARIRSNDPNLPFLISHRSKSAKSPVIFQRSRDLEAPRTRADKLGASAGLILRTNHRHGISGLPANESPSSGFRRVIKSARKGGALFLTASAVRLVVINTFPSRITSLRHSSNISENISTEAATANGRANERGRSRQDYSERCCAHARAREFSRFIRDLDTCALASSNSPARFLSRRLRRFIPTPLVKVSLSSIEAIRHPSSVIETRE